MGPVPVRHHHRAPGGARRRRTNTPPHRLAVRDSAGPATATKAPRYSKASRTRPIRSKTPRPLVELVNRPAADARHALAQIGRGRIPATTLNDLLIGVSEAVSNAQRHGRPPATVRIWATPDRIVVTVHDTGRGPADPLAGLIPAPGSAPDRRLAWGSGSCTSSTSTSRSSAHRRRLHRQAPRRNDTRLTPAEGADRRPGR